MIESELKLLESVELSFSAGTLYPSPVEFHSMSAILQALPVARSLKQHPKLIRIGRDALRAMKTQQPWLPDAAVGFRFARSAVLHDQNERLEAFWLDVGKALRYWGLTDSSSGMAIQGAFREMNDNVIEHSGAPTSGMCGFRVDADRFEFGVSDSGVGLVGAFRDAGRDVSDKDESELLESVVTKGLSRLGRGRGTGFATLLRALRRVDAVIRVRSDNVALRLDPAGGGQYDLHVEQKPELAGFVVCASLSRFAYAQ